MKKTVFKGIGYTAVGLGFAGAFLPLLPTTPFLLLAVYCFSKSSPRMNAWLLENRFCGRYIRDYKAGAGIAPEVKVATILMLWGGISFSAIVFVEQGWIRAALCLIAVLTTGHILRIGHRRETLRIHVFAPTETEIAPFRRQLRGNVSITVTGIGMVRTAVAVEHVLQNERPDRVILAGIAGAYPGSGLNIGDCVTVSEEQTADLGSFVGRDFLPKFVQRYDCPGPLPPGMPSVASNSVNAAGAPYLSETDARIENMEGAAFFACCLERQIPFWEIRAVSNIVGEPFERWNLSLATRNLARTLNRLIHETDS